MGITCLVIYKRELVLLLMLEAYHTSEVTITAYQIVRRSLLGYTTILKDGRVAEQGSPDDLVRRDGDFARMVRLQHQEEY